MVEAALVFPIVILSVMALIYMLIFIYQQTQLRAQMHMALRAESGRASQTVEYLTKAKSPYPVYRKGLTVYYEGVLDFRKKGLLIPVRKDLSARGHINDEVAFIRLADLVKAGGGEDEE